MKRFLLLTLAVLVLCTAAFAAVPAEAAAPQGATTYFDSDFEDQTIDDSPQNLRGQNGTGAATTAQAVIKNDDTDGIGKYVSMKTRVRAILQENGSPIGVSNGVINIEFDANIAGASAGIGIVYENSLTTYQKFFFGWNAPGSGKSTLEYYPNRAAIPPNGGGETSLKAGDGITTLSCSDNGWHHYKIELNVDKGTFVAYVDGEKSEETGEISYLNTEAIGGIAFYTSRPSTYEGFRLDNVSIYRNGNSVKNAYFVDYDGNAATDMTVPVPAMSESLRLEMSNQITATAAENISVELVNNTTGETETAVTGLDSSDETGKTVKIKPVSGFFVNDCEYTVTVQPFNDAYGQPLKEAYTLSFTTDRGGLRVMGITVKKDGVTVNNISSLTAGDTVAVEVSYVLTHTDFGVDSAIIALTSENRETSLDAYKLVAFDCGNAAINELGMNTAQLETVIGNEPFKRLTATVWDTASFVPMTSAKVLEVE